MARRRGTGRGTCTIADCHLPVAGRGWCTKHWTRWRRYGDPTFTKVVKVPRTDWQGPCSIDGCSDPAANSRGWCNMHYLRWYRRGDPLVSLYQRGLPQCTAKDCEGEYFARGLCRVHYHRAFPRSRNIYIRHLSTLITAADGRCALCGYLVDLAPDAPRAMGPSVDHIVPGRDHRLENLRLTHQSCNSARHDRADVHVTDPPWVRNPDLEPVAA